MDKLEARMDQLERRVDRLETRVSELEAHMDARFDALDQRLASLAAEARQGLTVLHAASDHFARKIGILERDVAVLRGQAGPAG